MLLLSNLPEQQLFPLFHKAVSGQLQIPSHFLTHHLWCQRKVAKQKQFSKSTAHVLHHFARFSCLFALREYGYYPSQSDKTCKEKFKTVNKETHPCPDQGGANHIHFFTPARSDDWKYWRVLQLFKRTTKIYCSSQFLRCTEVWRRCRNELEVPSSEDTLQKHT